MGPAASSSRHQHFPSSEGGLSSNKQVLHEAAFVPYRSTAMKKVKQLEEMCKQESLAPKEIQRMTKQVGEQLNNRGGSEKYHNK